MSDAAISYCLPVEMPLRQIWTAHPDIAIIIASIYAFFGLI